MQLAASAMAYEAAAGLRALVRGRSRNLVLSNGYFEGPFDGLWRELCRGSWHLVGAEHTEAGAQVSLVDLVPVVAEWGRHLIPLPYLPTLLIARWSNDLDAVGARMLTFSVSGQPAATGAGTTPPLAPFGACVGVELVTSLADLAAAEAPKPPAAGHALAGADWSPSLPLLAAHAATDLSAEQRAELAVLIAAELSGCGNELVRRSIAYAQSREQFGVRIASFQAVAHLIADMQVDLESARTAVIWGCNEPSASLVAAGMTWGRIKRIGERAMQVHGGFGFTWEAGLHFFIRHVMTYGTVLRVLGAEL